MPLAYVNEDGEWRPRRPTVPGDAPLIEGRGALVGRGGARDGRVALRDRVRGGGAGGGLADDGDGGVVGRPVEGGDA